VRRTSTFVVILLVLYIAVAAVGESFPEGNVLRESTGWLRDFGRKFADGFGGGYNPGTP
jgi:hypothetical protein